MEPQSTSAENKVAKIDVSDSVAAPPTMLSILDDDGLTVILSKISRWRMPTAASTCQRLLGLLPAAEAERLRRFKASTEDPLMWRGGGRKAAEAKVAVNYIDGQKLALSPDGSTLVSVGSAASKMEVTIYEAARARVTKMLSGPSQMVCCVAIDDKHIVCGDVFGNITVWSLAGEPLEPLPKEHSGAVFGLALLGDLLVSCSNDNTVKLWSLSAQKVTHTLSEHTFFVLSVAVTKDAIASGSADKTARIWPLDGGGSLHTLQHPNWVWAIAMAGNVLVTGCDDQVVRTFAVATGKPTRVLRGHTSLVYTVALSGSMVLSGGYDKKVKVWALTL